MTVILIPQVVELSLLVKKDMENTSLGHHNPHSLDPLNPSPTHFGTTPTFISTPRSPTSPRSSVSPPLSPTIGEQTIVSIA